MKPGDVAEVTEEDWWLHAALSGEANREMRVGEKVLLVRFEDGAWDVFTQDGLYGWVHPLAFERR